MDAIKRFVAAAGPAVEEFLEAMPEQDKARAAGLLAAGNGLSISMVVQADGATTVLFEAALPDGTRRVLAHVCAAQTTMQ